MQSSALKILIQLILLSLVHLSASGGEPAADPVMLLEKLRKLNAPLANRREEDIAHDWNYLRTAGPLLDHPLLLKVAECLKERDLARYVAAKEPLLMLDQVAAVTPSSNLVFAWRWAPEHFEVTRSEKVETRREVVVREKLDDSKIYTGYEGEMKIDLVEKDGILKLVNISFRRQFTSGGIWETDLLTFLGSFAGELKRERIDALSKPRLPHPEEVPPEVLERME